MLPVPTRLQRARDVRLAQELSGAQRHALRNHLAALRNATHFVRKQAERAGLSAAHPRVVQMLDLSEGELRAAAERLQLLSVELGPSDAREVARALASELAWPSGVEARVAEGMPVPVACGRVELALALYELFANAVDAGARLVQVTFDETDGQRALQVVDDGPGLPCEPEAAFEPGFTTRSHRHGQGLNIARRLALGVSGSLVLHPRASRGVVAVLRLPAAR